MNHPLPIENIRIMHETDPNLTKLYRFVQEHQPLFVLTGAGCSTSSGLADYRDVNGNWKRQQPITGQTFVGDRQARQRYWARSAIGWPVFEAATPNATHVSLAQLQMAGFEQQLVTQNVDGLHQKAGHRNVIELHGQLDSVVCLDCGRIQQRANYQQQLLAANSQLRLLHGTSAPDGDADIELESWDDLLVPRCRCGGLIKPSVVFFGENVPRDRVQRAFEQLEQSAGMLVIGSSLMVYSGFRFCKQAASRNIPIASINRGKTRGDDLFTLNVQGDCADTMTRLINLLTAS